jgi:hypothetical protein
VDGLSGLLAAVAAGRRSRPTGRAETAWRLGDVLGRVIEPIRAAEEQTGQVERQWAQVVPPHMAGHCRIRGIERGQLQVAVDSPVYAYEVRMCSHDLLAQIRQRCPRLGIKKIKVTLA